MSNGILNKVPEIIRTYNVSRSISTVTRIYSTSTLAEIQNPEISPAACVGFAVLILSTVIGNTLVLSALFLDKRLHVPSFFLIANMGIADLLLGLSVLPFSSVLEILNDRWIFGPSFCTAWLALDVLCCTASIMALMGVSVDRYIGVTRPLNYSAIMTTRRTVYLIIIVWGVSILTSVVPLFGLTDRGTQSKSISSVDEPFETCKVNKDTFYTIFSSMMSFYIPVVILLILYSRVYQEAKKQGEKLENEKRRLYEMDYQIASKHVQRQKSILNQSEHSTNGVSTALLKRESFPDENSSPARSDVIQLKKDHSDIKNNPDDDTSHSEPSGAARKNLGRRLFGKRLYSSIRQHSQHHNSHSPHDDKQMSANEELQLIKRKLHNLKREKKAFRTVGLILGALLICWLPFFVTLPIMSILTHYEIIQDKNSENTWFKIAFWLGYCNSALNPFVYAFSNRAIRRAFREVIFRRCCCCICGKKPNRYQPGPRQRTYSGSITSETAQIAARKLKSKPVNAIVAPPPVPVTNEPAVSFTDFPEETGDNDISSHEDKQSNQEFDKKDLNPTST